MGFSPSPPFLILLLLQLLLLLLLLLLPLLLLLILLLILQLLLLLLQLLLLLLSIFLLLLPLLLFLLLLLIILPTDCDAGPERVPPLLRYIWMLALCLCVRIFNFLNDIPQHAGVDTRQGSR